MTKRFIILGASGHAKVVASTLHSMQADLLGFYDDDKNLHGTTVLDLPVLGDLQMASLSNDQAVIGIGLNNIREMIAQKLHLNWANAVHAMSVVDASVSIGRGNLIAAGVVVQPDTTIGDHCIINTSASVDHDCVIDDFAHIAPGCHLAGGVKIGKSTLLGVGASVLPGVSIGKNVVIGAGSVVISDVPDGMTMLGVPAVPLKKGVTK
jgi:sugar O-acyltransferase (sialic acid O-acetyltransferase NeuD family)